MKLESMIEEGKQYVNTQTISVAVITNISLDPYFPLLLNKTLNFSGFTANILPIPFEDYFNYDADLHKVSYILVWPHLKTLVPDIENLSQNKQTQVIENLSARFNNLLIYIRDITEVPIFWMGLEDYDSKLIQYSGYVLCGSSVAEECNKELLLKNIIMLDLKRIIAEIGISGAYDPKSYYRWNAPYSNLLLEQVSNQIAKQIYIDKGLSPKCLVLDCDNVLWGGILSEDGIEGVLIGTSGIGLAYQNFQRFVLSLGNAGIILALCSKNDKEDIIKMLHVHSGMLLHGEHIACIEAGWEDKPSALIRISEKLNIGLDSMVFVDDSAFEIQAVQTVLPQIKTFLFDRYNIYSQLDCFNVSILNTNSKSATERLKTYHDDQLREHLLEQSTSYEEFLKSLSLEVIIKESEPHEHARIAELSQRTNRCTNGKRYTLHEVNQLSHHGGYSLYSVYVRDKLGDLGLVGTMGVNKSNLDLFCLSCRALGREIEQKMLDHINIQNYSFQSTEKNQDIIKLLEFNTNSESGIG